MALHLQTLQHPERPLSVVPFDHFRPSERPGHIGETPVFPLFWGVFGCQVVHQRRHHGVLRGQVRAGALALGGAGARAQPGHLSGPETLQVGAPEPGTSCENQGLWAEPLARARGRKRCVGLVPLGGDVGDVGQLGGLLGSEWGRLLESP